MEELNGKEFIEKSLKDPDFRTGLKKDPRDALKSVGIEIPDGVELIVHENGANKFHGVLPLEVEKGSMSSLEGISPMFAQVYQRAWSDAAYREKLMKNPKEAFTVVTKVAVPESLDIEIHENGPRTVHIAIPYARPASGELSDSDLETVAGGKGVDDIICGVVGNVSGTAGGVALVGAGVLVGAALFSSVTGVGAVAGGIGAGVCALLAVGGFAGQIGAGVVSAVI